MKKRITSTVIIGIVLVFLLLYVLFLSAFNMKLFSDALAHQTESGSSSQGVQEFLSFLNGISTVNAFTLGIFGYGTAIALLIGSTISLGFAIDNRKSSLKTVRVINIVYVVLLTCMILFAITKILLFIFGIA